MNGAQRAHVLKVHWTKEIGNALTLARRRSAAVCGGGGGVAFLASFLFFYESGSLLKVRAASFALKRQIEKLLYRVTHAHLSFAF